MVRALDACLRLSWCLQECEELAQLAGSSSLAWLAILFRAAGLQRPESETNALRDKTQSARSHLVSRLYAKNAESESSSSSFWRALTFASSDRAWRLAWPTHGEKAKQTNGVSLKLVRLCACTTTQTHETEAATTRDCAPAASQVSSWSKLKAQGSKLRDSAE